MGVHGRARAAGRRRRHDGAGRTSHRAAQYRKTASGPHDRLPDLAGAHRAGDRPAARRADHHLQFMAVDFPAQRAAGADRAGACPNPHSQHARRAPRRVRLAGLCAHRVRKLQLDVRSRSDRAPQHRLALRHPAAGAERGGRPVRGPPRPPPRPPAPRSHAVRRTELRHHGVGQRCGARRHHGGAVPAAADVPIGVWTEPARTPGYSCSPYSPAISA